MCRAARNQHCSPRRLTWFLVAPHGSLLSLASYLSEAILILLWTSPDPSHDSFLHDLVLSSFYVFPHLCLENQPVGPFSVGVYILLFPFYRRDLEIVAGTKGSDVWTLVKVRLSSDTVL